MNAPTALPFDNIPQLIEVIRSTFTGGSSQNVMEATRILKAMSKETTRFIHEIMKIILMEEVDGSHLTTYIIPQPL